MTNEKASVIIGNIPVYGDECYSIAEYQEAKTMAVQALLQEPKTGHWISFGVQGEVDGQIVETFTCSECGAISIFRVASGNIVNGDLCPNCGAKMSEILTGSESEE